MYRMNERAVEILEATTNWKAPEIPENIPHGDMPGDKVEIGEEHKRKSEKIMERLLPLLSNCMKQNGKAVISVCGGSGVGKSENASLISFYLNQMGIKAYTMSGDNYPRRIPMYNDAERLMVFRKSGIKALVEKKLMDEEVKNQLQDLMRREDDANLKYMDEGADEYYPWFATYIKGALEGLKGYLGTDKEIDFDEVSEIIAQFKAGKEKIYLKRMGRTDVDLWYDEIDFSDTDVLVVEWTHGNSDYFTGVDIPVFLNSTPEETMAHRRARNRDGKVDSAFTTRVLEIEQEMLYRQAKKAKIILSKSGEFLTYDELESR